MSVRFACSAATSRRPAGCSAQGQPLPISENEALFQLIGTTYGGDGQETFGLPNLNGRVPMHQGTQSGTTYQHGRDGGVGKRHADDAAQFRTILIPCSATSDVAHGQRSRQ